jgi:hypothetical protein
MTRAQLIALYRKYDPDAHFVCWGEVVDGVRQEHPAWRPEAVRAEADRVYEVMVEEEGRWYHSQWRFRKLARLSANPYASRRRHPRPP